MTIIYNISVMKNELLLDQLKTEKASKEDWDEILALLEETNLIDRISGNGTYESFYTVKIQNKIICCFAVLYEGKIGILKSFGIKKEYQGKGIGKNVSNKLPELLRNLGLTKIYAASWEAPDFWGKVGFQEVNFNKSSDDYFLQYAAYVEKNYPQFASKRKYFVLKLTYKSV